MKKHISLSSEVGPQLFKGGFLLLSNSSQPPDSRKYAYQVHQKKINESNKSLLLRGKFLKYIGLWLLMIMCI